MSDTVTWLRELGAVRPMATAAENVLVLGKFRDGFYPIEYCEYFDKLSRDIDGNLMFKSPMQRWLVFGVETYRVMNRDECERILKATGNL